MAMLGCRNGPFPQHINRLAGLVFRTFRVRIPLQYSEPGFVPLLTQPAAEAVLGAGAANCRGPIVVVASSLQTPGKGTEPK